MVMRDAVALEGQIIKIEGVDHIIKNFYFITGTNYLYVGLLTPQNNTVNYAFEKLLPFLIEQIKL
jgi:hypothetical protein